MHLHYQIHKTKKKTKNKVFFLQFNTNVLHSSYKIEILLVFTFFTLLLNLSKIINDKCKSTIPPFFFQFNCLNPMINAFYFFLFFFFFLHTKHRRWPLIEKLFTGCNLSVVRYLRPSTIARWSMALSNPRSSRLVSFSFALIYRHLEYFPPLFFLFILPFVRLSNIFPRNCIKRD